MADARITIEGAIASDPRFNSVNGDPVANLRVLAGRSRKNDDGSWETLSTTAYDVSFWREHAQLSDSLRPEKGSKVIVSGTVSGVESYQGQNGESLSVKVNGDGLRVFPKRDQQGGYGQQGGQQAQGTWGGGQQSQQGPPPGQGGSWGANPSQQQDPWAQSSMTQQGDPWSAPQSSSAPF